MDFLNKIGTMAKNASNKVNDSIEINRLNFKINDEESKIATLQRNLGQYYWTQFEAGAALDDDATAICASIQECRNVIADLQQQIASLKQAAEAARQQAHAASDTVVASDSSQTAKTVCPNCGYTGDDSLNFCPACGTPMQKSAPATPKPRFCSACGQKIEGDDVAFCSACGARL